MPLNNRSRHVSIFHLLSVLNPQLMIRKKSDTIVAREAWTTYGHIARFQSREISIHPIKIGPTARRECLMPVEKTSTAPDASKIRIKLYFQLILRESTHVHLVNTSDHITVVRLSISQRLQSNQSHQVLSQHKELLRTTLITHDGKRW